nr:translation initiation factor IF-2-like [Aegilops tauschii subsp. strangulata]
MGSGRRVPDLDPGEERECEGAGVVGDEDGAALATSSSEASGFSDAEVSELQRKLKLADDEIDRINKRFDEAQGSAAEVETLKSALAKAKKEAEASKAAADKAAVDLEAEQVTHRNYEERVIEVEQALQDVANKCEAQEERNKAQAAELNKALQEAKDVRGESRAAREEIKQAGQIAAASFLSRRRTFPPPPTDMFAATVRPLQGCHVSLPPPSSTARAAGPRPAPEAQAATRLRPRAPPPFRRLAPAPGSRAAASFLPLPAVCSPPPRAPPSAAMATSGPAARLGSSDLAAGHRAPRRPRRSTPSPPRHRRSPSPENRTSPEFPSEPDPGSGRDPPLPDPNALVPVLYRAVPLPVVPFFAR